MPLISVELLMSDQGMELPGEAGGEVQAGAVVQSPGVQLAAAREARGWSIEQVASQLNLAPRQIQAMESDDYAALPGLPIARGFIRAYAKLLRIDATQLLASVPGEVAGTGGITPPKALATPFAEARLPSMTGRSTISAKKVLSLVALLLVLVGGWWAQQQGMLHDAVETVSAKLAHKEGNTAALATTHTESQIPREKEVDVAVNTPEASTIDAEASASTGPMESDTVSVTTTTSTNDAASPPASVTNVGPTTADSRSNAEHNVLVLKVRADSWVEVRRADNSVAFSGNIKSGKSETIALNGPGSLVIGNSAGVDAFFRGAPLELKANTNNNVARLSLK
jgi:cytoskeleton protein RodZ